MKPAPESQTLSVDTTIRSRGINLVVITTDLLPASGRQVASTVFASHSLP